MCSIEVEFHGVYSWMVEMIFIKKKQSKNKGKITGKMEKKERGERRKDAGGKGRKGKKKGKKKEMKEEINKIQCDFCIGVAYCNCYKREETMKRSIKTIRKIIEYLI